MHTEARNGHTRARHRHESTIREIGARVAQRPPLLGGSIKRQMRGGLFFASPMTMNDGKRNPRVERPCEAYQFFFLAFASYTASGHVWMGSYPAPALKQNKSRSRDEGIPTCSHLKRCVCSIWCSITARSRS